MGRQIAILSSNSEALEFLGRFSGSEKGYTNTFEQGNTNYQAFPGSTRLPSLVECFAVHSCPIVAYVVLVSDRRPDDVVFFSRSLKQKPIVIVYESGESFSLHRDEQCQNVAIVECDIKNTQNVNAIMSKVEELREAYPYQHQQDLVAPVVGGIFHHVGDDGGEAVAARQLAPKA